MTALYLLRRENVLLLYRQGGRVVNDVWIGSAGGHFENNELNDAEACMLRELYEELHLTFEDIENTALRYVTLRRTKEEIRQNYYFFANLKEHVDDNLASNEGVCKWFSLNETSSLEMPFTAKYVMDHFCTYRRYTDKIYVGIAEIDGVKFLDLPYTENKKL